MFLSFIYYSSESELYIELLDNQIVAEISTYAPNL